MSEIIITEVTSHSLKNIIIKPDTTIKDAMGSLNKTAGECLLVVDEEQRLLGTLTDGDLRRSILSGTEVSETIASTYFRQPTVLTDGQYTMNEAGKLMQAGKLTMLPILDKARKVVDYLTWEQVFGLTKKKEAAIINTPVVIMAGGKGTRLEPFTKVLPKPLVPIHDKPVIEHIIEKFTAVGVNDFYLTVNYKARILKAYFEEMLSVFSISFVDEKEPLGTVGSLQFLKDQFDTPFMVTNCDIIIDTDYADLYDFHIKKNYDITLVASTMEYVIPYGTCELNDDGCLAQIKEKPQYNLLVNTGLYVINPAMIKLIPENKIYHFTDLIEDAKNQGHRVGVYPISEDAWVDVGQWAEYQKAIDRL